MIDPYVYPGTKVLRNKFNISDYSQWKYIEGLISATRIIELRKTNRKFSQFDFSTLKEIHHYIFQDIYDWAGIPRIVPIAKANTLFCLPENIDSYADAIFSDLKDRNFFKGYTIKELSVGLGRLFCDINMLHPFREGNGRTQRGFLYYLSHSIGYDLDLSLSDKSEYNKASLSSPISSELMENLILSSIKKINQHIR